MSVVPEYNQVGVFAKKKREIPFTHNWSKIEEGRRKELKA